MRRRQAGIGTRVGGGSLVEVLDPPEQGLILGKLLFGFVDVQNSMKTVAELIDQLFRTHRRPDGREYTYKEVSLALDRAVEPSHLSKLRTGKITNPGRETLLGLCRFFQVPPSYFFPELELSSQSADSSIDNQASPVQIALRSTGLSPEVQEKLEELIRALQQ